jgi:hypothetical protein
MREFAMETTTPPDTTSPTPSVGKRNRLLPFVGLVVMVVAAAGIWWFGIRDTVDSGDLSTAEQLSGTWHDVTPGFPGYYFTFDEEGQWDLYFTSDIDSSPDHWGTHTLDGDRLTMTDALDANPLCKGEVGVWTVSFSPNGDEAYFTFASDTCTESARGQDWTLVRQSP